MKKFIDSCKMSNSSFAGQNTRALVERSALVAKMLNYRTSVRSLIAPSAYGKSTVAFQYASTVFDSKNTFWIKCTSPCFVRDLDSGELFNCLIEADTQAKLVVFDDLPKLFEQRTSAFYELCEALLGHGVEVIITSRPKNNSWLKDLKNNIVINAEDLHLTLEEIDALSQLLPDVSIEEVTKLKHTEAPIAAMLTDDDWYKQIIAEVLSEDVDAFSAACMALMLITREGITNKLVGLIKTSAGDKINLATVDIDETIARLALDYPYLGINESNDTYKTIEFPFDGFTKKLPNKLRALFAKPQDLYVQIADDLVNQGRVEHACDFMRNFATKPQVSCWLERNSWSFVLSNSILEFMDLLNYVKHDVGDNRNSLDAVAILAAFILQDDALLKRFATRLAASENTTLLQQSCAHVALYKLSHAQTYTTDNKRTHARKTNCLNKLADLEAELTATSPSANNLENPKDVMLAGALHTLISFINKLDAEGDQKANLWLRSLCNSKTKEGQSGLISEEESQGVAIGCLLAATISLDLSALKVKADESISDKSIYINARCNLLAGEWALEYLSDAEELFALKGACFIIANDSLSLINYAFHGEAALEFSPLLKKYLVADANALNKTLSTYKRLRRKVYNAAIAYRQENPDPFRRNLPQEVSHGIETEQDTKIPMLYVSLFGGTEISIGGKKIDLSSVTRKKALTLLAMLVLNRGNVVSRRTIADELWPDGGVDSFKTNFYTIWSQLKAILKVDGRCPYLLRTKDGCSINLDYVDSDVFHYDGLCRTLLFGSDKSYTWERLYDEVSNRYSSELLPHEESNEFIKSTRLKYKTQIVDGLIATSTRLNALNESMGALWFAREALGRDNLREDVYIALMEAQIASNQRSAAVDTYFMCRRTLCDKLGIDPSLKMVSLYNSVIQDEEVFV